MKKNPKRVLDRIHRVLHAWETSRPNETFAGLTLAQFRAIVRVSLDARAEIAALSIQLTAAATRRDDADDVVVDIMHRIVGGVQAHPLEGANGGMYKNLGYVITRERKTGLTRRRRPIPTIASTPAATAAA